MSRITHKFRNALGLALGVATAAVVAPLGSSLDQQLTRTPGAPLPTAAGGLASATEAR